MMLLLAVNEIVGGTLGEMMETMTVAEFHHRVAFLRMTGRLASDGTS